VTRATVAVDGGTITVHIPLTFKALARAFWWQRMLDDGVCGTIGELAKREGVNRAYVSRVLRLKQLALEIVEAMLDGRQSAALPFGE
jgi:hypothetical protein